MVQMRHVAAFLVKTLNEHNQVWKDAQFGDPVLDLLHFFDKLGFTWQLSPRAEEEVKSLEEDHQPKPKQNEKVAQVSKPRAKTAARKNGAAPDAPVKAVTKTVKAPVKAPAKTARKRIVNNDGWIPGGG